MTEIGLHLQPLLGSDQSGVSYHGYGPNCPVTSSAESFPHVSGCVGMIMSRVQGHIGYCWIEQGMLYPMIPHPSLHPLHNHPQAAQIQMGDTGKKLNFSPWLDLDHFIRTLSPDPKLAPSAPLLLAPISGLRNFRIGALIIPTSIKHWLCVRSTASSPDLKEATIDNSN